MFEKAKRSVVYISTSERVRDWWTRNVHTIPRGTGSGFVWDEQGHIVTNRHVISGASEARIRLNDGRDYPATLVGVSALHDLAVLRIVVPSNRPPPLPVGTSHNLRVGQRVYAIGNPFGLDWSMSMGIVSWLVLGLIAGFIAQYLFFGGQTKGIVVTIILGILGALAGGFVAAQLGFGDISGFDVRSLVIAVGGAVLLLFGYRLLKQKNQIGVISHVPPPPASRKARQKVASPWRRRRSS